MSRVWKRVKSPTAVEMGIQAPSRPREMTPPTNSLRREVVSHAEVTGGIMSYFFIADVQTTTHSPSQQSSEEDEGWEVHFKRKQRPANAMEGHRVPQEQSHPSPPLDPRSGSPQIIWTPSGLVEVCRQCLRPGHMAADCQRGVTCRIFGGTGHKARQCHRTNLPQPHPRREIDSWPTIQQGLPGRKTRPPKDTRRAPLVSPERGRGLAKGDGGILASQRQHETVNVQQQQRKLARENKATSHIEHHHTHMGNLHLNMEENTEGKGKKKDPSSRKIDHLHTSLALDGDMVEGKEEMKTFTVASVTKIRGGFVEARTISAALKESLGGEWDWPVKEFRDGRFMLTCKSPAEAREIERFGELHFTTFSIKCEPWSADIWKVGPLDGEIRWLNVRRLPTFCWNRNSTGRVLKAVGDLLSVDRHGGAYVDDIRVLMRIRRGRTMPCIVWTDIGSRKYKVLVGMERGQAPLPWNGEEAGDIGVDMEEDDTGLHTAPPHPKKTQLQGKVKTQLQDRGSSEKGKSKLKEGRSDTNNFRRR
ncbi:hypothetical protein J5N97_011158 [Dioscorea zingiberensis]|uniref:CCHC-type domain-containing protein n=1 Tax=Dioscorea zingiberensis TaxID=325984 RepID=A0A9D5D0S2_9LILI|nr:hypothetical protein J5N97_011158 [Dioscorea zingiberensis]